MKESNDNKHLPVAKSNSMMWSNGIAHREAGKTQMITRSPALFCNEKEYKIPVLSETDSHGERITANFDITSLFSIKIGLLVFCFWARLYHIKFQLFYNFLILSGLLVLRFRARFNFSMILSWSLRISCNITAEFTWFSILECTAVRALPHKCMGFSQRQLKLHFGLD